MKAGAGALLALCLAAGAAAGPTPGDPPSWTRAGGETAALLSRLIRFDTSNPPGGELPAARHLEGFLAGHGLETRVFEPAPGRGSLVARLPATAPTTGGPLLLLSHLDVVAADPAGWSVPPFSGAIRDGFVHGRGALDDKGQAAVFAMALALLARDPAPRHRDLVFCASADEETGGDLGVRWLIENHWQSLGPPAVVWNEGGGSTAMAAFGDVVLNGIATTEKRALWLRLIAEGEGGHGAQPRADAAGERLVRGLARLLEHRAPPRITPTVRETFARLAPRLGFPESWLLGSLGNPLLLRLARPLLESGNVTGAMIRDTLALTGLEAGVQHNLIPARAEARLDVRLLPDTDAAGYLAELGERLDDGSLRFESVLGALPAPAPASPWDHPLFVALEEVLADELPGSVTAPLQSTGATDSLFFRERGVPAYGYLPARLSDSLNASIHGVDERVPVAELERALRVTWRVLRKLTGPGAASF